MKYLLLLLCFSAHGVELTEQQAKIDIKAVEVKQVRSKTDMTKALAAIKLLSGSWAKPQE